MNNLQLKYLEHYDVVVIGGGSAGICAAVQAARSGSSTLLIEKGASLGGTTTNGAVNFPGLFNAWGKQIIAGIGWELTTKSVELSGGELPDFSIIAKQHWTQQVKINIPIYTALCDEILTNSGAHILFHTMIAGIKSNKSFDQKTITICTKNGLQDIKSKVVIDCTGDANAAALAGFELLSSTEKQPATYSCHMNGYDYSQLDIPTINKNFTEWVNKGNGKYLDASWNINQPNIGGWLGSGGMNANHIPHIDAFNSFGKSIAELEGRASILRIFRFLKTQLGLDNLRIDFLATECGIRETRRIVGKKIIEVTDYNSGKVWDDSLCYSYYPIDLHTLDDSGVTPLPLKKDTVPTVPLGAMLPKNSSNFLVAGRCVSSDQLANSALRVQASSMAMGQAAGATAALAVREDCELESLKISVIKAELTKHAAIVP